MIRAKLETFSYALFLFLLIFSPLAFGTVENWSLLVMETVTAVAFLLMAAYRLLDKEKALAVPGGLPFLILLGLMLLQLLPLPVPFLRMISPSTFEIYRPLLEVDPSVGFLPLSVHPRATLLSLLTFSAYGLFYALTVYHLSRPVRLKKTVAVVVILGTILAIEAILQKLTAPGTIYWLRDAPTEAFPVGPWVYSNHYAGFMEMVFPLVTALFLYYRPEVHYATKFREKVVALFTMPGANRHLLLATGAILMAVSILISLSRGGIITLCTAFLFFTVFTARATHDRRTQWAIFITLCVVLICTWLGWQPLVNKFGKLWQIDGLNTGGRLPVYLDTLNIIRSFPLFGTGAGTFVHIYPAFRTIPGDVIFDHAHNDFLELLADTGAAGFMLAGWFVLAVLFHSVDRLLRRRDRFAILIAGGAVTGMLALLFHCLVDFQIYNGANGLYFFFLSGLAVSGANTRIRFPSDPSLLRKVPPRLRIVLPCCLALLLFAGSAMTRIGIMTARDKFSSVRAIYLNPNIPTEELARFHAVTSAARKYDPLEPYYFIQQGMLSFLLNRHTRAQNEYLRACFLNPMSGAFLQQLGIILAKKDPGRTEVLLKLGIVREPFVAQRYLQYSDWLLTTGREDQAAAVLHEAMTRIPIKTEEMVRYILNRRLNPETITAVLPSDPFAWYTMGRMLEKRGRSESAEVYYLGALHFLDNHDIRPDYFTRLYFLYRKQKRDEEAIGIIRQGIEYLPDYPWFRVQLGDYYHRQGIEYRAVEEYRRALLQDPGNRDLAGKIRAIENP